MKVKWLEKFAGIYGVKGALLVDHDGLVVAQTGDVSDQVAPRSALMVKRLVERIGSKIMEDWLWTQCETPNLIISISNVDIGILVLLMQPDSNLSRVRLEAMELRRTLGEEFGPQAVEPLQAAVAEEAV